MGVVTLASDAAAQMEPATVVAKELKQAIISQDRERVEREPTEIVSNRLYGPGSPRPYRS